MDVLPTHAISKQEWFMRCRQKGMDEAAFLHLVDDLVSNGMVVQNEDGFSRNREAGV